MKYYLIIFLFMIFLHIVDDYYLQGCLANLKQKKWWKENAPDTKYKYDYIVALIMHSISWTFMIMLPIMFSMSKWLFIMYPVNIIIHAVVDDLKANKLKINLVIDQTIHIAQILLTFILFILGTMM